MSKDKNKPAPAKGRADAVPAPVKAMPVASRNAPPSAPAAPVAPLFRGIDWWAFAVTSLLVFIGYLLTLAPNLTLEDSGELSVASLYAGVPHPPGYPVWTIYTWFFANFLPISNTAYRVGVASALAGALACGVIALMTSRGSSMIIEGIEELKAIARRWENALCLVAGFVAGMLMGFNGYFWSQAVIVEVYTLSVLSLVLTMVCLLRWIYAPQQRRYLYWALFIFGVCFTNHQTLIVAAIGIEVAVAAVDRRLGRDLFLGNSVIYLVSLLMMSNGLLTTLSNNRPIFAIFNVIGVLSLYAFLWFSVKGHVKTKEITLLGHLAVNILIWVFWWKSQASAAKGGVPMSDKTLTLLLLLVNPVVVGLIYAYYVMIDQAERALTHWKPVVVMGALWVAGAALYFWMPISSMSNPPLNWGYPRTVEGFWHALTRGQYEKANPSNIISDPLRFVGQLWMYAQGCIEEFNLVYLLLALVPWLFVRRMQKREQAWMAGLSVIYLGLAVLLLILLNPAPDRQSRELNRVFFTSSHVIIAMSVGYGLTLIGAYLQLHYERVRRLALGGAAVAAGVALYAFTDMKEQYLLARVTAIFGMALALAAVAGLLAWRQRAPLTLTLALFAAMPAYSVLGHWWDNEQRGHLFGYWFGHDMFTPPFTGKDGKPLYPEMERDTVLFGGTDPGRFNPTYMIYADSFVEPKYKRDTDPNFDRRDVYLITQNALADATYLMYIRAHYNRSAQIDPPFFSEFFKTRLFDPLDKIFLGLGDYVEKQRRAGTSYFKEDHFTDAAKFAARLRPGDQQDALSKHLFESLSARTQKLVQEGAPGKTLARALAKDLNVILERELNDRDNPEFAANPRRLYDTNRFAHVSLSRRTQRFIKQNPQSHTRIRLNRLLLEEAYPDLIVRSKGGVYPDLEILTPTVDDSQLAFQDYIADAQRRLQAGQLKPGEDVRVQDNRVQVSGQVAVMAINGLLTKVIFDKNPDHEFYVEESFPLDWMFPHLTPYGIIMKINRQPVPEMTEDILQRDHEFWAQYSTRFIGNWITYDTPISNICAWAEQVYLRRDLRGFTGDPKFIRDDNAQKAFSKLRSAIGGLYAFRINTAKTPAERARVIREADFAFKQAYAFCPFSPEAVFRYVNLLVSLGRPDDAILITRTCQKLDPDNSALQGLLDQLEGFKRGNQTEKLYRENPTNFQVAFNYAADLLKQKQTQQAVAVLDSVLNNPQADPGAVLSVAQAYLQIGAVTRLENAMKRLTGLLPDSPEGWYDLAAVQAILQKTNEAMGSLSNAMKFNAARKAKDPNAKDLLPNARGDQRFEILRRSPEFHRIVPP